MATDETQTGRKKINPLQIHQTGKNKKIALLTKKNNKKFWLFKFRPYLCGVIDNKTKNLKLQNYADNNQTTNRFKRIPLRNY